MSSRRLMTSLPALLLAAAPAFADDSCDAACQAARKAQDPLAPITGILTDNTLGFGPTGSNTSQSYSIQPVHTFQGDGANFILRGMLPYLGTSDGKGGTKYGWGDTVVQGFYVPDAEPGAFKLGYGAQLSFDTADKGFSGPGNGAGLAVVGFGFSGNWSYGGVLGHLWGENDFSLTTIQPIAFYNFENFLGGSYIGYSNTISYDWRDDHWTVPVGATFGKTFVTGGGNAIDVNVGAYKLLDPIDGGDDGQIKFGVSWIL